MPREYSDEEVAEMLEYYQHLVALSTAVMAEDQQVVESYLDSIDLRSFVLMTVKTMLNDMTALEPEDLERTVELLRKPPEELLPEIGHKVAEMQTWLE